MAKAYKCDSCKLFFTEDRNDEDHRDCYRITMKKERGCEYAYDLCHECAKNIMIILDSEIPTFWESTNKLEDIENDL